MGGLDGVIAKARGYKDESDLRFATMLLAHAEQLPAIMRLWIH
jgi:hypothetical protein